MPKNSVDVGLQDNQVCGQLLALPIKLYLYGALLFELYRGGRTRPPMRAGVAHIDAGLFRSSDALFEVHEGTQVREPFEIEWERLGFAVDDMAWELHNYRRGASPINHHVNTGKRNQSLAQLSLWGDRS